MPERGVPFISEVLPDGAWKGERCFLLGGGPSLIDFDWGLLRGAGRVIAVNRAIERAPWADMMFSMDSRLYRWYHEERNLMPREALDAYDRFKGIKVWLDSHHYKFRSDVYLVNWIGKVGVSRKLSKGIYSGGNSGFAALSLAVALGCNPIVLLGYDMGHSHGLTHWHDGYAVRSCDPSTRTWVQGFEKIAPALAEAGVQVVNANPNSNIRCFPFGNVVNRGKPKSPFIVCSFYTLDYMESAMRLRVELDNLGIEHHLQKISRTSLNYQDWQRETFYKANFVRDMMNKYPERSIVWIDADAEVLAYPDLFDDFPGNLGARIFHGTKLLSGTVYFRNCPEVRTIVDDWIRLNQKPNDKFRCQQEQMNLQAAIEQSSRDVRFVNLPAEYCYIFDERDKVEQPIIIHRQHSRKFRGKNAAN